MNPKLTFLLACLLSLLVAGCSTSKPSSASSSELPGTKSHFAQCGTNKVHYHAAGKGAHTVVLVHGWSCNSTFWAAQIPALSAKARVLAVDLPGHGQSDKPHADYTMDFFAQAVVAVMKDARVDKATLIGQSMGAPVICRVYAQAPDKVAGLVAVDGILRRPEMAPDQVEQFTARFSRPDYQDRVKQFAGMMFPNPGTEALRDRVAAEMLETPQYVMSSSMKGMFDASQPAWDLSDVKVPVMAINAVNPMWTPEYETYVRKLSPKTDYRVIQGTGHFVMMEKPAEFNVALTEMLEKFDLVQK